MSNSDKKFEQTFAESITWDEDVSFGSSTTTNNRKLERFKAKVGKVPQRLLIIDSTPTKVIQHYKQGFGYLRCLKSVGKKCAACDRGEIPAQKFGVNVLVYPDGAGTGKEVDSANVKVLAWLFGIKTYNDLRAIRSEWGELTTYDIKINCQNEKFQHIAITNCRERLLDTSPDSARIESKVQEDKYDLKAKLGRTNTEEQMEGIYSGTISADDLFKRKDSTLGGASAKAEEDPFSFPGTEVPEDNEEVEITGTKLDFDRLLD